MPTKLSEVTRVNVKNAITHYLGKTPSGTARAKELTELCEPIVSKTATHVIMKEMVVTKQLLRTMVDNRIIYKMNPKHRPMMIKRNKTDAAKNKILETLKKSPNKTFRRIDLVTICKDTCSKTTTERAIEDLVNKKDVLRVGKKKLDLQYNNKKMQQPKTSTHQHSVPKNNNPIDTMAPKNTTTPDSSFSINILKIKLKEVEDNLMLEERDCLTLEKTLEEVNKKIAEAKLRYNTSIQQENDLKRAINLLELEQDPKPTAKNGIAHTQLAPTTAPSSIN